MSLKVTKETVFRVDYNDLSDFIAEIYGLDRNDINLPSSCEWPNDSSQSCEIRKEEIEEYDQESLDKFKNGEQLDCYNLAWIVLTDLCNQDLIPAGSYVIDVCW